MAAAAILNFGTSANAVKPACSASQDLFGVLIGWKSFQRFNSYSFYLNSRWQPPPSWILSQSSVQPNRRVKRYRSYLAFKFGENRSNSSKVTALFTNSRWRPPPSWILWWSLRRYPRWFCSAKCTLIPNLMKIGWLVQKLQLFFKILILAGFSAFRGVLG